VTVSIEISINLLYNIFIYMKGKFMRYPKGTFASKYGSGNHPIFKTLARMKSRCYNNRTKSHKHYEGKGVKVCDEWLNNRDKFF